MSNLKVTSFLKLFMTYSLISILTACDNSNGGITLFNPNIAPQNVQVVSGDDDSSEVRNTISWTLVPGATDYVVYVDNTPGVTENSSVVTPSAKGFNYFTHSGVDVLTGNTYYYKVQALSGASSSPLSDEVSGTPQQSQTNNALNDVAWNGTTLVTVGDQGTILSSQNGVADGWTDISSPAINLSLAAVAVDSNSDQFLIVGASSTVLIGDGTTNSWQSATSVPLALNLEDVVWLNPGYVAVGKNGSIITSNDGDTWTLQNSGLSITITLKAVASNGSIIVAVGTNGTILTSTGGVAWQAQPAMVNNDLNDISWDGNQFGVVGSNDTILTSPDGLTWTSHIPGTPNITFVAASHWDSSLPVDPVLGAVGSAGTYVVSPDKTTGFSVPTGTNNQLSGMTWVDNVTPPYFVMVGNDGTVLSSQIQ